MRAAFVLWLSVAPAGADPILTLGDRLLSHGLIDAAITEYRRYIFFNADRSDSSTGYAYAQIALGYRHQGRMDAAVDMLLKSIQAESRDEVRDERRVDLGVSEIARGRYDLADFTLLKVEMFSPFEGPKKRASFFRGICNLYEAKWDEARVAFRSYANGDDEEAKEMALRIDRLLATGKGQKLKSPGIAKMLSSVVPGLGEVYATDWRGGASAFAINAATGYLVLQDLAGRQIREAFFDTTLLFGRFYGGNRKRAVLAVNRYNETLGRNLAAEVLKIVAKK